jgi:PAS domain S-box-containing protein
MKLPLKHPLSDKGTYWLLCTVGFLVVAAGIFVASECRAGVEMVRTFYVVDVRGLQSAGEMGFEIQEGRRTVIYALTTNDPNRQLTYIDQARAAGVAVANLENRLSSSHLDDAPRKALQAFSASWEAYLKIRDRVITQILIGRGTDGLAIDLAEAHPAFDQARDALSRLLNELDRSAERRLGHLIRTLYRTMDEVCILLVGMLFFLRTLGTNIERRRTVDALQKINSELKITQRTLRERELHLRTLFDNVIDGIITADENGIILSANRATERIFAYQVQELIGQNVSMLMPPPQADAHDHYLRRYRETGVKKIIGIGREVISVRKDGVRFPVDLAISELLMDGRKTFVGILRDITERKKAEDDLRSSRRQLMGVTANIPGAVFQIQRLGERDYRFLFVSDGIETLHGRTSAEILENPALILERIHHEDVAAFSHELSTALQAGSPFKFTYRIPAADTVRWLAASAVPQHEGSADLVWNGVLTDVTSAKEAERQLNAYAEQLSVAVEKAQAATRAKSEFLATMSHEIRTPMNGVIGMTALLSETDLTPEQRDYAETIRSSGEALLAIINDILEFSKIEAGKLDLENRPFDVRSVVEESLDVVAPMAHRKKLELCAPMDDAIPSSLLGDPARLRQILLNLLSNAVKFTEAGEVILTVAREETGSPDAAFVRFEVRDTGIGISPDAQPKLFQSFSQADSSTTKRFGGTGLGLAICKRLVELMGGTIGLRSAPGSGSVFWFTVPFKITTQALSVPAAVEYLRNRRVLAVDDNGTNRSILKQQLGKIGMIVTCAANGQEALEELRLAARHGRPFELAILDLHMPAMNGLTLAREIRRIEAIRSIPLMMLTSDRDREEAVLARQLDVKMFLVKPVRQANLIKSVSEMFGAHSPENQIVSSEQKRIKALVLVVEDNPTNQKVIVLRLEKLGCSVGIAHNGQEAIDAAQANEYDAILMDCQMPVMDGFEATAKIRETATRHVPIIALTANAMQGERERCLEAGMDDYLSKPVRAEELYEKLQLWLAPKTGRPGPSSVKPEEDAGIRNALTHFINGMQQEGIGRDDVNDLFESFLQTSADLMHKLQAAATHEDSPSLAKASHSLKGTFATFGLESLTNLAAELERAGREQRWEGVAETLKQTESAYDRTRDIVTGVISHVTP